MVLVLIASVAFSMALCALLTLLMRGLARRIGFVDRPGGHKTHDRPTAQGGGIAIFCTLAAVLIAGVWGAKWLLAAGHTQWAPEALRPHLPGIAGKWPMVLAVLGGALVLHVVGLIDDVRPLRALPKFVAQVVVATVLVVGFDIRAATALGPVVSSGATVLWLVVVINAFNFLDNIDGLSAGVAAITASIFACSATLAGQLFVPAMAWVLVGTMLGYLLFNFPPASIFMGDAGSMVIGYFLGILTVLTTYFDPSRQMHPTGVLAPLIVLAVPLYDVVSVVIHRLRAGESPFRGDRRHFSHRLVKRGMTTRSAVLTIYLATAATSLAAVVLPQSDWPTAAVIFAQSLCILLIIAVLEHAPLPERT